MKKLGVAQKSLILKVLQEKVESMLQKCSEGQTLLVWALLRPFKIIMMRQQEKTCF